MTPAAYYDLALEAGRLYRAGEFAAAEEAYARLAEAYPWDSENWFWLGYTRFRGRNYAAAAEGFERAHELGVPAFARWLPSFTARAYALSGQSDRALEWLERALEEYRFEQPQRLLQDSAFVGLREHPRFKALAPPQVDGTGSRVEGWRIDLDYLLDQARLFDPVYHRAPLPDSVLATAERIREEIPTLTDMQVILNLQTLAAMLGHGHTGISFGSVPARFSQQQAPIPLTPYLFPDGLYVIQADSTHRSLIGSRVLEIEGTSTAQMLEALRPLTPAEGAPYRAFSPDFLFASGLLHELGLARDPSRLRLTVLDRAGETRSLEVPARPGYPWYDDLPPSTLTGASPPLYLSRGDPYWLEHLLADSAAYVRLRRVGDGREESLSEFGLRLRRFLEMHGDVKSLILDLRGNAGGNSYLYPELLKTMIAFDSDPDHQVFAIIDRGVFSAAMNLAADLDRLTSAVFIGEPTGAPPEQFGDAIDLALPYSGVPFRIPSVIWNLSSPRDTRRWIAPDVPVALRAEDYFANRDPAMEAALELIRRKR